MRCWRKWMASFTRQSPFAGRSQTFSKCNFLTKYAVVWQGPYKLMPQVIISYYRYYVTLKKKIAWMYLILNLIFFYIFWLFDLHNSAHKTLLAKPIICPCCTMANLTAKQCLWHLFIADAKSPQETGKSPPLYSDIRARAPYLLWRNRASLPDPGDWRDSHVIFQINDSSTSHLHNYFITVWISSSHFCMSQTWLFFLTEQ